MDGSHEMTDGEPVSIRALRDKFERIAQSNLSTSVVRKPARTGTQTGIRSATVCMNSPRPIQAVNNNQDIRRDELNTGVSPAESISERNEWRRSASEIVSPGRSRTDSDLTKKHGATFDQNTAASLRKSSLNTTNYGTTTASERASALSTVTPILTEIIVKPEQTNQQTPPIQPRSLSTQPLLRSLREINAESSAALGINSDGVSAAVRVPVSLNNASNQRTRDSSLYARKESASTDSRVCSFEPTNSLQNKQSNEERLRTIENERNPAPMPPPQMPPPRSTPRREKHSENDQQRPDVPQRTRLSQTLQRAERLPPRPKLPEHTDQRVPLPPPRPRRIASETPFKNACSESKRNVASNGETRSPQLLKRTPEPLNSSPKLPDRSPEVPFRARPPEERSAPALPPGHPISLTRRSSIYATDCGEQSNIQCNQKSPELLKIELSTGDDCAQQPVSRLEPLQYRSFESDEESEDELVDPVAEQQRLKRLEYPDMTAANHRPPNFREGINTEIKLNYEPHCIATNGRCVVVASSSGLTFLDAKTLDTSSTLPVESTCMAVAYSSTFSGSELSWLLWIGLKDGRVLVQLEDCSEKSQLVHTMPGSVVRFFSYKTSMFVLDEQGNLSEISYMTSEEEGMQYYHMQTFTTKMKAKYGCICGNKIWLGSGKTVFIGNLDATTQSKFELMPKPLSTPGLINDCTSICSNLEQNKVFIAHLDGKIALYDNEQLKFINVLPLSWQGVHSVAQVDGKLWVGFQDGFVMVYDTSRSQWRVCKVWKAHKSFVKAITSNLGSLWQIKRYQVITASTSTIRVWDGLTMDDWLDERMRSLEKRYCSFRNVKAVLCTWNIGTSKPREMSVDSRCPEFWQELIDREDPPGAIVFGFQELIDLGGKRNTARSLLQSKKKAQKELEEPLTTRYQEWQDFLLAQIEKYFGQGYVHLKSVRLIGLFSCIFVQEKELREIRGIETAVVKTGLGGRHGNKGAVISRFLWQDSSICFVNCHLAAGQHGAPHRNNDVADILDSKNLKPEENDAERNKVFVNGGDGSMVLDHEVVILSGDLNYRISLGRDSTISRLKREDLSNLLEHDQLTIERQRNPNFLLRSFRERPISFKPTYKYNIGTDKYDTSDKRRVPAWCDRILLRASEDRAVCDSYDRHELRCSDHRPVSAKFSIRLKSVSPAKRREVFDDVVKDWHAIVQSKTWSAKVRYFCDWLGFNKNDIEKALSSSDPISAVRKIYDQDRSRRRSIHY